MAETSENKNARPNDIAGFSCRIVNYKGEAIDITDQVDTFNIYEDLTSPVSSCELLIIDALGLPERFPIVGEEYVVMTYRTRGQKKFQDRDGEKHQEEYDLRVRSFRVYKLRNKVESKERQHNYVLMCVDDHLMLNEMTDLDGSFVGQNCTLAANTIFHNNFIKTDEVFRPFDKYPRLYGVNKNDVLKSVNNSSYIAPGVTPFEAITYLREEAQHENNLDNNSDYVFFQTYLGFHLTTLSELKNQTPQFKFVVQDGAAEERKQDTVPREETGEREDQNDRMTVNNFSIKKTFDTLHNLSLGTYGNRVAAIDILTKKFDEKSFSYNEDYKKLKTLDVGRLTTDDSLFKFSGSTHTRYLPTELLSTNINTGSPTGFTPTESSYATTPYFFPIDKENPDEKKDKISGTISNKAASERLAKIIANDPKLANPRRKQHVLNERISSKALLDNILINITVPGNSDVKVGDTINLYIPQTSSGMDELMYNMFFGQVDPKFLVVKLRQSYENKAQGYQTVLTVIKDSFKDEIATTVQKVNDSEGVSDD